MMTWQEYVEFVNSLASPASLESFKTKMAAGGLGLAGEAGEVADIAKKVCFHEMEFTPEVRAKLIKEIGDIMWYVAFTISNVLDCTLDEIINENVVKLTNRYPSGEFNTKDFMKKEDAKNG
jgi:NTP pyrophosphatase (non-canonical NTP hydrolase)